VGDKRGEQYGIREAGNDSEKTDGMEEETITSH
jgi:hypothetical protein